MRDSCTTSCSSARQGCHLCRLLKAGPLSRATPALHKDVPSNLECTPPIHSLQIASVYPSALIINLVFPLEQQVPNHCLPVEVCLIQLRSRKPEDAQLCRAGLAARRTTAAAAGASVAVASAAVAAAAVATVAAAVATTGQALIIWPIATVTQLVGVRTLEQTLVYLQYFAASSTRFQAARLRNVYTLQVGGGCAQTPLRGWSNPGHGPQLGNGNAQPAQPVCILARQLLKAHQACLLLPTNLMHPRFLLALPPCSWMGRASPTPTGAPTTRMRTPTP